MSKQQQQILARQRQLKLDRQALIAQPAFCRVMGDILIAAKLNVTSFAGEMTHVSAFQEGIRNLGLRMLGELSEADPRFQMLVREHALPDHTLEEPTE